MPTTFSIKIGDGADLTAQQKQIIIEVRRAVTVVLIVFQRRLQRSCLQKVLQSNAMYKQRTSAIACTQYLNKLADIARLGLNSAESAPFAAMQLDAFKDEFVAREADAVKSQHVRALGGRALVIVVIMSLIYVFADWLLQLLPSPDLLKAMTLRYMAILVAGACCGTWLSFSIRRVVIGFSDLSLLEEDRLAPLSRLVFVGLLTTVFGLLLVTHLVVIQVGDVHVTINRSPVMTLLIGMLCGIAERALAGAVAHKAGDVVGKAETITMPVTAAITAGASR